MSYIGLGGGGEATPLSLRIVTRWISFNIVFFPFLVGLVLFGEDAKTGREAAIVNAKPFWGGLQSYGGNGEK